MVGVAGVLGAILRERPRRAAAPTTDRARAASCPRPPSAPAPSSTLPDDATAEGKTYVATVTTNCGDIELTLDGAKAPQAVASFVELAKQNYYLNAPCHRLTTDAALKVLQCGDPTGTGQGTPGYGFAVENAPKDGTYPRGTLAMARTSDPKKGNGGQFFIVYGDSTLPDPDGYTVFGTVTVRVGYCRQDRCRRGRPRRGQRNRRVPRRTDQHPPGCCHREEGLTVSDDKPTPRPTIPSPAALARMHPRPVGRAGPRWPTRSRRGSAGSTTRATSSSPSVTRSARSAPTRAPRPTRPCSTSPASTTSSRPRPTCSRRGWPTPTSPPRRSPTA